MPIRARKSESKREFAQVYKRSATALKVNMFFRARRLGLRDVYNRMGEGAAVVAQVHQFLAAHAK
jgi:hypothetical protein